MNAYCIAASAGVVIFAMWILAYILCWVGQWAWAWIDDSEVEGTNKLVKFLAMKVFGYGFFHAGRYRRFTDSDDYYKECRATDGEGPFFLSALLTALLPLAIVMAVDFYPVTIGIVTAIGLAMLARFSRRVKKQFDAHAKDKDAHK